MEDLTVGKILLKNNVPANLQEFIANNTLDKKGIAELFQKLSVDTPEVYKSTVTDLTRLGFEASTRQGSTVPLADLRPLDDKDERFDEFERELAEIKRGLGTKKEKEQKLEEAYARFTKSFEAALMAAGIKKNHTLAKVITSGSRGSMSQYRQTVGGVILVNDEKGRPLLDFPIKHSFAEGLTIPEYLLHSYGTRTGAIATKLAVADSGFMAKQMTRAAMPIIVEEHDCGTDNGISRPVSDIDNIGSFLAKPVGGHKKNNEVTASLLADLTKKKIEDIMVRSPITCQSSRKFHFGAVCQLCIGKREKGRLPPIGDYVGITAVTPLGEGLSQGTLNTKHTSSGATLGKTTATGFKLVQQLANIPHTFQNRAAVAELDGTVSSIKKLAQGGYEITVTSGVNSVIHYVPAGFEVNYAVGDKVESGDILTEGLVNPADIVKYKGIGEGRKYYADVMHKAFKESGMPINHRNFQVLAKATVDHIKINHPDGLGEHLPDSIASYQSIEKDYKPRADAQSTRIDLARGKYLEEPILHYTIGTRLSSKMIDYLKKNGVESVMVHDEPPPFEPEMVRLLDTPAYVPDWAHQLYSTYLEKRLIKGVNEGLTSNLKGPSPILGLAYGAKFGDKFAEDDEEEKNLIE